MALCCRQVQFLDALDRFDKSSFHPTNIFVSIYLMKVPELRLIRFICIFRFYFAPSLFWLKTHTLSSHRSVVWSWHKIDDSDVIWLYPTRKTLEMWGWSGIDLSIDTLSCDSSDQNLLTMVNWILFLRNFGCNTPLRAHKEGINQTYSTTTYASDYFSFFTLTR